MHGVGRAKSGIKASKQSITITTLSSVTYNGHKRLTKVYLILFTFAQSIKKSHFLGNVLLFEINVFSGSNIIGKESFI